jgi:hypothetical protein
MSVRVYETEYGWVAADDGGWFDAIYATKEEALRAGDLPDRDR